jgi:hypothetical protein
VTAPELPGPPTDLTVDGSALEKRYLIHPRIRNV